jgi:ornithine cyclodeaminase/alanine dehydrogenase-like protein (mu-crystallin family)
MPTLLKQAWDTGIMNVPLLYLSAAEVRRALPMSDAIDAMRVAFLRLDEGHVTMPPRGRMDIPEHDGTLLLMPCQERQSGQMSVKLVSLFTNNRERDLPLIHATVILSDAESGLPLAIMDGAALTAIRTAAVCGLATRYLALPDAKTAAIFGAGMQARSQLEALHAARPIEEARVFDIEAAAAAAFAREMSEKLGIDVRPAESSRQALANAQIVCTATTASEAVFQDAELLPGTHINAIGSYKPHVVEIPAATVCRARVVVDQRSAALEEAGDLLNPIQQGMITADHIRAELAEVVTGKLAGRTDDDQITLFKSVGLAVQDLYAAARTVENARRQQLGIQLPR